jgi:hypothetical protein
MEDLHQSLSRDIENKPKKWSSELLYCRKSLENVAEQKLYREATMIKQVTDALEEEEEANMNAKRFRNMSAKVRNLEKRQKADVAALMKRIETKRRETTKKREEDTARLVQRNRSIVKMLESKNVSLWIVSPFSHFKTFHSSLTLRVLKEIGMLASCLGYSTTHQACAKSTLEKS